MKTIVKSMFLAVCMVSLGSWSAAMNPLKSSLDFDDYSYAERNSLNDAVDADLKTVDSAADNLHHETTDAKKLTSPKSQEELTDLQAKRETAHNLFSVLKEANTKDSWDKAKGRMEDALEAYLGAYNKALDRIQDEEKIIK